jgi:hypothetical protein
VTVNEKLTIGVEVNVRAIFSDLFSHLAADEHELAAIQALDTKTPRQIFSLCDWLAPVRRASIARDVPRQRNCMSSRRC